MRAVDNLIKVTPHPQPSAAEIEQRVQEAIAQVGSPDPRSIQVTIIDGTVHPHGCLPSLEALQAALDAAETTPDVTDVESEIVVTVRENRSQ